MNMDMNLRKKEFRWDSKAVWKYLREKQTDNKENGMKITTKDRIDDINRLIQEKKDSLRKTMDPVEGKKICYNMDILEKELKRLSVAEKVEEIASVIHYYIPLVKDIAEKSKGDISDVAKLILSVAIGVMKDIERETAEISKINAKRLFLNYTDLVNAGFTRGEAFKIVLAKIKPLSYIISEILSKAGSSISSSKS